MKRTGEFGAETEQISMIGREVYRLLHPPVTDAILEAAFPREDPSQVLERGRVFSVAACLREAYSVSMTPMEEDTPANRETKTALVRGCGEVLALRSHGCHRS